MPKPLLTLVSISGAQATGKSTLLRTLASSETFLASLRSGPTTTNIAVTPSFGTRLFERWKRRQLSTAPMPVANYDQIDTRGHREWFQRQLPDALAFEVETAAHHFRQHPQPTNLMLVDRWFPDIMAHTRIGLPKDDIAQRQIRRLCRDRHEQLLLDLQRHFDLTVISVFVPLAASQFDVVGQEGKFRATVDRAEFERLCLEEWPAVLDRQPTVTISSSSMAARVLDVETAVRRARATNGKPTTV